MNAVAKIPQSKSDVIEQVLISGDLAKLTPDQRVDYYNRVCDSVGINPLTQPFSYITLNGKLTLYALRGATDQLRSIHNVSVEDMSETEREGVCIVTVKVRNAAGRTDIAKGAVSIANLKGEALANAIMKAETKAKRRATLSICGLAFLDELEVETIPGQPKAAPLTPPPAPTTELTPAEEAALDRSTIRENEGYIPDAEVEEPAVEKSPAELATIWAKAAIEKARSCKTREQFDAWYTPAVMGAVKRLEAHDKGLQNLLVEAICAAQDRLVMS